jgi:hypothetical protein
MTQQYSQEVLTTHTLMSLALIRAATNNLPPTIYNNGIKKDK